MSPAVRIYPAGSALTSKIERAQLAAWHQAAFFHLPIHGQYEWATGDDFDLLLDVDRTFVGSVSLIKRQVLWDGKKTIIGGIRGLVIDPAWRGRGLGGILMREAHEVIFRNLKADFGFLFCTKDLKRFYQTLGWMPLSCPVVVEKGGKKVMWSESAMILKKERGPDCAPIKSIDINGKPF